MKMHDELEYLEYKNDGVKEVFTLYQDKNHYHFTSDSILLAKFSCAKKGNRVADFCAGCGVVGFQFMLENQQIADLTLIELQEDLANLAKKTVNYNQLKNVQVIQSALQDYIKQNSVEEFDIILCNPPYERGGFAKDEYHKAICRKEITITLDEIIYIASKKLKFGGKFVLCHKAERLAEVIYTMHKYNIEPKKLQFIKGKMGDRPYLFLMEGRKGGKIALEILEDKINYNKEI